MEAPSTGLEVGWCSEVRAGAEIGRHLEIGLRHVEPGTETDGALVATDGDGEGEEEREAGGDRREAHGNSFSVLSGRAQTQIIMIQKSPFVKGFCSFILLFISLIPIVLIELLNFELAL